MDGTNKKRNQFYASYKSAHIQDGNLNQLKTYEPKTLTPPTKEEKKLAKEIHGKIVDLISSVRDKEAELDRSYISLGKYVLQMQVDTLWLSLGYESWKSYFSFLQDLFGKGRTQLYSYVSTARVLLPSVDENDLMEMGVSKAQELKKAVELTGKSPSPEIIQKGIDPKVTKSDFRQAVLNDFHIVDHNEKGTWVDLGGCYMTPDEKEEFFRSVDLAKKTDPTVPHTLPAHVQFKEVLLRFAREYWSSYSDQSFGSVEGFNKIYQEVNSPESELYG